jgi:hypothetical protein
MNAMKLSLVMVAGAATLAFTTVHARNTAWQNDHQNYEFKHPQEVTCSEYLDTEEVYRNYVTAWATGHTHGAETIEVADEYEVVSVEDVVEQCKSAPDKSVWEVVNTMVKGHN